MSPMESFFSVNKKVFIKVSPVNNQLGTIATLLRKGRGRFLTCPGPLINLFCVIYYGFYSTRIMSCFHSCRDPILLFCGIVPNFPLLYLDIKTCSQTLANNPSFYFDIITLCLYYFQRSSPFPLSSFTYSLTYYDLIIC